MRRVRLFFLLLITLVSFSAAQDINWLTDYQGLNAGKSVCQFLTLPTSAQVLSRGLASSPGAFDATDMAMFPANTALSDRNEFAVTHLEWLMGLRNEYAGAMFPMLDIGTFGIFSRIFTTGRFENARTIDEEVSRPVVFDYTVGLSYAHSFLRRKLAIGFNAAIIQSRLDEISGQAFYGGIDIMTQPMPSLSARLYALNIGTSMNYVSTPEPLPMTTGLSVQYFPIPRSNPITSSFDLSIGAGVQKLYDEPIRAGFSLGCDAGQYFKINSGYEYTYGNEPSLTGLSAGVGFHYDVYGVDVAWKYQSPDFGSVWAATIKLQLEEIVPKTANDYFAIALKHFEKDRFNLSIYFCKKALKSDPNYWKAYALISRIKSEILRRKHLEIAVIYTGNMRGQFVPYPPTPETPGGLARQAAAVNRIRAQFPISIALDGGNMLTKSTHPLRAQLTDKYYDYMKYNVVAPGEGEMAFGLKTYFQKARTSKVQFVCSNYNDPFTPDIINSSIVTAGPYKFFIASVIGNNMIDSKDKNLLKPAMSELSARLLYPDARKCTIRIAIIHDTWENIKINASSLEGADLIICSSLNQRFEQPMKLGNARVLSAGSGGNYVGNCILRFNEDRKLISVENHLVTLTNEIPPDTTVEKMVASISAQIDLEEQGIEPNALNRGTIEGIFPFVSDRNGKNCLFLKIALKLAEFPLACGQGNTRDPVWSFKAGKMAFIEDLPGSKCSQLYIMDITGAFKRQLTKDINVKDATFTPDGKWLYYSAGACENSESDIYRIKPDGGPSYSVLKWDSSIERNIRFSPDGTNMVFCSNRDQTWQIYISDPEAQHPLRMTDGSSNYYKPSFNGDGTIIAYLSDQSNFGGKLDLWIYDRKVGKHRKITSNSNVKSYCWLNDGRGIVYSSGVNVLDLNTVDVVDNRFDKLIRKDTTKTYNEVNPKLIPFKGDDRIVYTREFSDGEKQVFWVKLDGSEDNCVVNSKGNDWSE